jgi:hypothetical protein
MACFVRASFGLPLPCSARIWAKCYKSTVDFRTGPEERVGQPGRYPLIFAAVLTLGLMVAYQIHRVRAQPVF